MNVKAANFDFIYYQGLKVTNKDVLQVEGNAPVEESQKAGIL